MPILQRKCWTAIKIIITQNKMCHFQFSSNRVLSLSKGIDDMGPAKWDLTLCLIAAWLIAFLCMIRGIKSSGKVGVALSSCRLGESKAA